MTRKRSRNVAAHFRVVADEVARLDQQIEEVERAGLLLPPFVALEALAHLLVQQRGEIGVGRITKFFQGIEKLGVRGNRLIARDADRQTRRRCPSSAA